MAICMYWIAHLNFRSFRVFFCLCFLLNIFASPLHMFTASKSPGLARVLLGFRWVCTQLQASICSLQPWPSPQTSKDSGPYAHTQLLHHCITPHLKWKELLQLCKSAASPYSLPYVEEPSYHEAEWWEVEEQYCSLSSAVFQALLTKFQALGCLPSTEFAVWFISFYSPFLEKTGWTRSLTIARTP